MNESLNSRSASTVQLDATLLDRLADGELSAAEYQQVLLALPRQPQAWQRCAEAFLEAQAWRKELGQLRTSPGHPDRLTVSANSLAARPLRKDWLRICLVAAASFLFAFVSANIYRQSTLKPAIQSAGENSPGELAAGPESPAQSAQLPTETIYKPVSNVSLTVNRPGEENPQRLNVPVFDPAAANDLLANSRPALSDDLLQSLAAEGHSVDLQRKLVPVTLSDGSQMMLPVEGYRIVPVSRPSY